MDKIEEVKKIHEEFEEAWDNLRDTLPDCSARIEYEYKKLKEDYYCKICQLFQIPLGENEELCICKKERPKIICLCGSTRFTEQMLIKQWELTKQGHIILSWCALPESYFSSENRTHIGDQEGVKKIVDEVHLRKIDLADEVLVINIGGYIGESTRNEINYAMSKQKPIRYIE